MDTATQALLGAAVGQAAFAHRLGNRAAVWGAIGGIVPDLDVLVIPVLGRIGEHLLHRGPTHAFWFGPVAGAVLGWATWKWYAARPPSKPPPPQLEPPGAPGLRNAWIGLWMLALFTHPLQDLFTSYGTQFFWPFSDYRAGWDAVAIVDPAYSAVLLIGILLAWRLTPGNLRRARLAAAAALLVSTAYLVYGWHLNQRALDFAERDLRASGRVAERLDSYPTLLQVYLRRVIAREDGAILVGYVSMWRPQPIEWERIKIPDDPRVAALLSTREGAVFEWFSDGQMLPRVIDQGETAIVEIDDIRFSFSGTPRFGIWGIRGVFGPDGRLAGEVEYYDRRPEVSPFVIVAQLFRDAFQP